MKTIWAIVKSQSGDSVHVYAGGETDQSGKLVGAIRVCCVIPNRRTRYTKSLAEITDINCQIAQMLKDLRYKITIGNYYGEEAVKRDYDNRWSREEAKEQISRLCELKALFSRILKPDDCFLQAIDC